MKLTLLIVLVLCICTSQAWFYKPSLNDAKYQSRTARNKLEMIQKNIDKNSSKPYSISLIKLAQLFIQDNNRAFDTVGDEMPVQGIFPVKGKIDKLIHSAGLIAQCKFESLGNHNYTGIFKGAENGFVRFSVAAKPDDEQVTPGFVFKFLRDNVPSANIFSMYQLGGQTDSTNIFEHDMSSHVPMINDDAKLPLKLLAKNFEKTSDYPTMLGLSDSASYDQHGQRQLGVNFPFRLVFHPSKQAHESMDSNLNVSEHFYVDAVAGKQFDTLFEVFAQATPENTELIHIGNIKMTTAFESSEYADQTLYFQHQRFEEDLKLRPEWKKGAEAIVEAQANTKPQFHFEDIGY